MNAIDPKILDRIDAALALLPRAMTSDEAKVMMYAAGLQESRFLHRRQLVGNPPRPQGPAKGFWQFERLGGCRGVVDHPASRYWMHQACQRQGVAFNATALWHAIEQDDVLAAVAARLLLFTDPRRLPDINDPREAWNLYIRTWRPGAFARGTTAERAELRAKWDRNHQQAVRTVIERAES